MRIVLLSHTGRSSVFRVGSHHLAREFARLGHDVVQISNPISLAHVVMVKDPEVRRRARMAVPIRLHSIDGARYAVPWSVFPLTPDPLRRPLTLGSGALLMRTLRKAGFGSADLVLVDQPLLDYLIPAFGSRQVIYRPTDINTDPLTIAAEQRVMSRAQGVIATSAVVAEQLAARYPALPYHVVENGAEIGHFAGHPTPWQQRRGAVYVGALDRRFDFAAVAELAAAVPNEPIDLYSPTLVAPDALRANVRLLGPVDYADLPRTLARYRVGLLPLNDDPTNSGRSPMKLYEYLASGLNVVTRSTKPIATRGLLDVHAYPDRSAATAAYRSALADPPTGDGAAAAAEMDWAARALLVLEACKQIADR